MVGRGLLLVASKERASERKRGNPISKVVPPVEREECWTMLKGPCKVGPRQFNVNNVTVGSS